MRQCAALCILSLGLLSSGYAQDTVNVKTGWNIIGSVKNGAVPDLLTTIPDSIITTSFFGYDPGSGYESTDTLGKGLGYWVKVSADGIIIFDGSPFAGCGVMRVEHGGFSYGTVQIGDQCWLSENLNVGVMLSGGATQSDNAVLEKYCNAESEANCGMYGGLYHWDEAMQYVTTSGTQGICPPGWHIPTLGEFQTLNATVSSDGNELKKAGLGVGGGIGTNTSGFSALYAGGKHALPSGIFFNLGENAYFWSSSEYDAAYTSQQQLRYYDGSIFNNISPKGEAFSVRCLED